MSATLIDAIGVARRFGDRTIFPALDLRIAHGDHVGLLGDNGTGKSTLLRLLAGRDTPDAGTVTRRGTLAYVPQLARSSNAVATVRELALEALGVAAASRQLAAAESALGAAPPGPSQDAVIARHAAALEAWLAVDAATADADLDRAADAIGLPVGALDRPRSTLSSGQGARAGLLPLAARPVDALLLDEPTNHLDAAGRDVLARLLDAHRGALVVASHDRALLAQLADRVVELRPRGEAPAFYGGGWDAYERERGHAARQAQEAYETAVAKRAELEAAEREIRRRAAATRSRVGATRRDNDKHAREWFSARADGVAARGRVVGERAGRVEIPERPWQDAALSLELTPEEQRAPYVVSLQQVTLRRGDWQIGPLDLAVAAGERLLLRGPNGSGKTTILQALAGAHPVESGKRSSATGAVAAVLGAIEDALRSDDTVADVVRRLTGRAPTDARSRLALVGLGADQAGRPSSTLSPGERTRAELAVIAAQRTTCLLLDEPSNHLDLRSLEALKAALDGWPGAVVLATHDERLAARLRPTRSLELPWATVDRAIASISSGTGLTDGSAHAMVDGHG